MSSKERQAGVQHEQETPVFYLFPDETTQALLGGEIGLQDLREYFQPAIDRENHCFRTLRFEKETGELAVVGVNKAPQLAGYLPREGKVKYGDSGDGHKNWLHRRTREAEGNYPNLVFFDSEETAAVLGEPCGSCWVGLPLQAKAVRRWQTYVETREAWGLPVGSPPESLKQILPQKTPFQEGVEVLKIQLGLLEGIAPEDTETIAEIIDETRGLVTGMEGREEGLEAIFERIQELAEEGGWESLQEKEFVDGLIDDYLKTDSEKRREEILTWLADLELNEDERVLLDGALNSFDSEGQLDWQQIEEVWSNVSEQMLVNEATAITNLDNYVGLGLMIYSLIGSSGRADMAEVVRLTIFSLANQNSLMAAEAWVQWRNRTHLMGRQGKLTTAQALSLGQMRPPHFLEDLTEILPTDVFELTGRMFKEGLTRRGRATGIEKLLEENGLHISGLAELSLSEDLLRAIARCFIEVGLLRETPAGNFSLTTEGKQTAVFHPSVFDRARLAAQLLNGREAELQEVINIQDLADVHEEQREAVRKPEFLFRDGPRQIIYIDNLAIGDKNASQETLAKLVEYYRSKPEAERQKVVIIASGFVAGRFRHHKSQLQGSLLPRYQDFGEQIQEARMALDELADLGMTVIYSFGPRDLDVCLDYTYEVVGLMAKAAGSLLDQQKHHVAYYKRNQMRGTKEFQYHLEQQMKLAYPYMLACGRNLYSAEEVFRMTDGQIFLEEYLMLLDAHQRMSRGESLPPLYQQVLELDSIPQPGQVDFGSFALANNLGLTIEGGEDRDQVHRIQQWSNLTFSTTPVYRGPQAVAAAVGAQMQALGREVDEVVVGNQHLGCVFKKDGVWVVCLPDCIDATTWLDEGFSAGAVQSTGMRKVTTSRRLTEGGIFGTKRIDRDSFEVMLANQRIMRIVKENENSEPIAEVRISDLQTGSPTFRPDLYIKALDIVTELLPFMKVRILSGDDHIQGPNYPGFFQEAHEYGLVNTADMKQFVGRVTVRCFEHVPAEHLENLEIDLTPGNHELNTFGGRLTGDHQLLMLYSAWKEIFLKKGLNPDNHVFLRTRVVIDEAVLKLFGVYRPPEETAGFGILKTHKLKAFGSKGAAGLAAIQGEDLINGLPRVYNQIDFHWAAHWHQPQILELPGGKFVIIVGAVAGLSDYEAQRGYAPVIGPQVFKLGAGEPPRLLTLGKETLLYHDLPQDHAFSTQRLADEYGLVTEPGHDPRIHGFSTLRWMPQSAIHQMIRQIIEEIHSPEERQVSRINTYAN